MQKPSFSALIIAKNEARMLGACLDSVRWCDEVIVVDDGSTDETLTIAEKRGAKVISFKHSSFARLREEALKRSTSDWVLYLDADERITPTLAKEVMVNAETNAADVLQFHRSNYFYGKHLEHGGWGGEVVARTFRRSALKEWLGDIHESPVYEGRTKLLKTPLIHLSHRDTVSGLEKTIAWTPIEAELLYKANVAPVTFWTLMRKGGMEFFRRVILKRGYQDGQEGVIEGLIQAINRMLVYIQVWERQQKPSIADRYAELESEVKSAWEEQS